MKRMYSLDFLKLVFAYVIAFFHFGHTIAPGPTVTVQLFFFISGYFLARKFYARSQADGGKSYSAWNYTLDHTRGLFPHYAAAYCVFFLYIAARAAGEFLKTFSMEPLRETLLLLYDQIPNLLFVQSAFYSHDSMNYPLWQLSALIISGYFVYALLCHNEKLSRQILFPAAILMTLSLIHSGVELDANYGPVFLPLLRAFCGLSFGVLVYVFSATGYCAALKRNGVAFNLAALVSLVCIFVYRDHSNIHYITGAMLILGCMEEDSWINKVLNRPCMRHCGKLSFSIYVNHALICRFTNGFLSHQMAGLSQLQKDLVFFLLVTVFSVFMMVAVDSIMARWAKKRATV